MKIQIHGLNDKQVKMLDKLWTCDTTDEILEWLNTLNKSDFQMAVTLQEMILDEMITMPAEEDVSDARKMLSDIGIKCT
jgi:hypothetical protein